MSQERLISLRKQTSAVVKPILDLIYPPGLYCIICGNLIDASRPYELCDHCREHIDWKLNGNTSIRGTECLSCCGYGMYERRLIFRLKYNKKKSTAKVIGEIMTDRIKKADLQFDLIIPVPMEKSKEKKRGFNHAYLIAQEVGKNLGKPVLEHGLVRIKKTKAMRGLGPSERRENISGAFILGRSAQNISGKNVLLLDDISTTFATGEECVKVLRSGNPREVCFVAFAARNF